MHKLDEPRPEGLELARSIAIIVLVVMFSGSCSGMTVGLFSMDPSHLKVKARSGATAWQRSSAKRILFFVERAHWSLVTLLVSNALAMTLLPIFLDALVSPTVAIIMSVTAVLFFGEVIPQALFVRHGFTVISVLTPLLFILLVATSPFSYPCAKLLDYVIGHSAVAGRDEIEKHVRLAEGFGDDADGDLEGLLLPEEIQVMRAALSMSKKTLRDVKGVAVEDAFMVKSGDELSQKVVDRIVREGKSRVPVYLSNRGHIIGVLLTKTLLSFAYQFHVTNTSFSSAESSGSSSKIQPPKIGELPLREPFRVQEDSKVIDLLNSFKTGQSHLAAIYDKKGTLKKFVTLDDIFHLLSGTGGEGDEQSPTNTAVLDVKSSDPKSIKGSNSVQGQGRDALVASAFAAIRESEVGSSNT